MIQPKISQNYYGIFYWTKVLGTDSSTDEFFKTLKVMQYVKAQSKVLIISNSE